MPLPSFQLPTFEVWVKCAATGLAAMFTGGALWVNLVEHPARMEVKDVACLRTQWKGSFLRAKKLQEFLGLSSTLAGCGACYLDQSDDRWIWLAGAGIMILVVPYTYGVMISDIKILCNDNIIAEKGEDWVKENIETWNRRHMVRSLIGMMATKTFFWGLLNKML